MFSASLIVTLVFVPKYEVSTLAQVNVPCAEIFFVGNSDYDFLCK